MKVSIIKRCLLFALVFFQLFPIWAQTEAGLNLGKTKFIQAPTTMRREARVMKISMSRHVITPRMCARVGGVAFVQVAEPVFEVNTFSLFCDRDSNAACAQINGEVYSIPLDVWQLRPIVNYADDENNAIVTLFGKGESRIQFHNAFIDQLLGLRMLQTDLMLANNYLATDDRWKLPSNNNGDYVMAESEKESFKKDTLFFRLLYDTSYDTMSLYASYLIDKAMDSIAEQMSTYIYTDFGEPITFNIEEDRIRINGKPYYRFTAYDSIMDTIDTYPEIVSFLDTLKSKTQKYQNTATKGVYAKEGSTKIKEIMSIVNNRKIDNDSKAKLAFEYLDFYNLSDSLCSGYYNMFALYNIILVRRLSTYIDSIEYYGIEIGPDQAKYCSEIKEIIKDSSIYDAPALAYYARLLIDMNPTDSILKKIEKSFEFTTFSIDDLLIYHIDRYGIRKSVFAEGLTHYLKENPSLVYYLNPLVIDAAQKTCQWAAFFRYAKMKNPKNWNTFVKQVRQLKYDAPEVFTPIQIERINNE